MPVWISLRELSLCRGGVKKAQGWHVAGNGRSTNVPKEETKSREETLELNVAMSAWEGGKEQSEFHTRSAQCEGSEWRMINPGQ